MSLTLMQFPEKLRSKNFLRYVINRRCYRFRWLPNTFEVSRFLVDAGKLESGL